MTHTAKTYAHAKGNALVLICEGCDFSVSGLPRERMEELFLEHLPAPGPRDWEVRVSPEGRVALWQPGNEPWYAFSDRGGSFLSDQYVKGWRRFLPLDTLPEG